MSSTRFLTRAKKTLQYAAGCLFKILTSRTSSCFDHGFDFGYFHKTQKVVDLQVSQERIASHE